tara:strand:+ start:3590 stop:3988 length:399 start_codon:yes stop_codon:yes gene_type:complete
MSDGSISQAAKNVKPIRDPQLYGLGLSPSTPFFRGTYRAGSSRVSNGLSVVFDLAQQAGTDQAIHAVGYLGFLAMLAMGFVLVDMSQGFFLVSQVDRLPADWAGDKSPRRHCSLDIVNLCPAIEAVRWLVDC